MHDIAKISNLLEKIEESLIVITDRSENIMAVNDFLTSQSGILFLDGICMKLIAVGESIKNLDKLSNKELLIHYPAIPWKEIMGMRDIIVHHYFEIDADIIFATVKESIPPLLETVQKMQLDLSTGSINISQ